MGTLLTLHMYVLLGHFVIRRVTSLVELEVDHLAYLWRWYNESGARYRPLEVVFLLKKQRKPRFNFFDLTAEPQTVIM